MINSKFNNTNIKNYKKRKQWQKKSKKIINKFIASFFREKIIDHNNLKFTFNEFSIFYIKNKYKKKINISFLEKGLEVFFHEGS